MNFNLGEEYQEKLSTTKCTLIHTPVVGASDPMAETYREVDCPEIAAIASTANAAIHQRRVYFVMTRQLLQNLVKNDPNLTGAVAFRNERYRHVLQALYSSLIELVQAGKHRQPSVYRIKHPAILHEIGLTPEEEVKQRAQCLTFIERKRLRVADTTG
jgi:hypothetical protein